MASTRYCPAAVGASPSRPAERHCAGHALENEILSGPIDIGSIFAISRHRHIDEARIDAERAFVIDAETFRDARTVVLQEDVGRLHQVEKNLLALRRLQVDGERALVAIERQERDVDPVPPAPPAATWRCHSPVTGST